MNFSVENTHLDEVKIINPKYFGDDRGFFMEVFNAQVFEELGLPTKYVQLNHSSSGKNVVRGLHFQWQPPMGKLMRVTKGKAFLVAVDIRIPIQRISRLGFGHVQNVIVSMTEM